MKLRSELVLWTIIGCLTVFLVVFRIAGKTFRRQPRSPITPMTPRTAERRGAVKRAAMVIPVTLLSCTSLIAVAETLISYVGVITGGQHDYYRTLPYISE